MKSKRQYLLAWSIALTSFLPLLANAEAPAVEHDNTAVNKRDRSPSAVTPDNQDLGLTNDTELTRRIRQAIVADESLSTYAHNIKIITESGAVTLRGPVRSIQEKAAIEAKAGEIAGSDRVKSEIQISPKDS